MTLISSLGGVLGYESIPDSVKTKSFYDLQATLPGKDKVLNFNDLKGKVVLIVNTASKCGFTPQYTGLEELFKSYGDQGLEVIGFPSNEFGGQEPGNDEDIAEFCTLNHGVTFPLTKKTQVNGKNMNEVFAWLKSQKGENVGGIAGTTAIKWNFTKFLIDKHGKVVGRYGSSTKPETLKAEIEKLLAAP
ncbi:glutathione peroxidase [Naematelia encephala]|uniref:Glutathione peroxidase n=1 Tax=Naematelia encephala TaxID=71784 RepID=A0A1Y2BJS3_9TREE|nr:glutathione peroxidase [Naematelia encephala]